ncbi:MAG: hypothetical protein JW797_02275 [Bradymonadales bacterium]|nr:hypothetical protein [Bradymonadales bacterium]
MPKNIHGAPQNPPALEVEDQTTTAVAFVGTNDPAAPKAIRKIAGGATQYPAVGGLRSPHQCGDTIPQTSVT